jgi:hypothetical protein
MKENKKSLKYSNTIYSQCKKNPTNVSRVGQLRLWFFNVLSNKMDESWNHQTKSYYCMIIATEIPTTKYDVSVMCNNLVFVRVCSGSNLW